MKVNWDQLTMKFKIGDEGRCIKGDASLAKTLVSLKVMMRNLKKGGQGYLIEFRQMAIEPVNEEIPNEVH